MRTIRYIVLSKQLGRPEHREQFARTLRARLCEAYPDASVEVAVRADLGDSKAGVELQGFDNARVEAQRVNLLALELLEAPQGPLQRACCS